ncbi:hypothetical protein WMY93_032101 [Mugilogobius chulae]|uniref:Uncharacterized protein n=1 Tax=Mugilogobius chulae TaxID=88201 RepID=A0AAW0MCM8_9GOBI
MAAEQDQVTLQTLMDAFGGLRVEVTNQITAASLSFTNQLSASTNTLKATLNEMNHKLEMLNHQVTEVQKRVSCNEDDIEDLKKRLQTKKKQRLTSSKSWRPRRTTADAPICVSLKFQKRQKGQDTTGFVQKLLIHLFGQENFPTAPPIEIAHRSPTQRRGAGVQLIRGHLWSNFYDSRIKSKHFDLRDKRAR